jgi:hypothetical protein
MSMENHQRLVKCITSGNRSHSQPGISLPIPLNANFMHEIMIEFGDSWLNGIQVADVVMMQPEVENRV